MSECDNIWTQGPYRDNQVKMMSLGWVFNQQYWCPYKKESLAIETDLHRGKTMGGDSGGRGPSINRERGPEQIFPSQTSKETNPTNTHIRDFYLASRTVETIIFSL